MVELVQQPWSPHKEPYVKRSLAPANVLQSTRATWVAMALNNILSQTNSQINKATIFTDNQGAIRSAKNPLRQPGQQILRFIVSSINMLCEKGIDPELHWVPAHKETIGNELADVVAKEVTGWRKVKKRNGKLCEIDTNYTAHQIPLPFLRSAGKAHLTKLLYEKWEEEWHNERQGAAPSVKSHPHLLEKCYIYMTSYQSR